MPTEQRARRGAEGRGRVSPRATDQVCQKQPTFSGPKGAKSSRASKRSIEPRRTGWPGWTCRMCGPNCRFPLECAFKTPRNWKHLDRGACIQIATGAGTAPAVSRLGLDPGWSTRSGALGDRPEPRELHCWRRRKTCTNRMQCFRNACAEKDRKDADAYERHAW